MADDVNIRISATDNATATLRAVQAQLNSFSTSVKNLASFTLAGIGVREVGAFLAGSLREYAEAEKSQTRLQSVLRATGNTTKLTFSQINEFTDQLEKSTGTSGEALNDAAANLSRFSNITGSQFKEVLSLANDMSVVLGGDVTSSVQTLARALNSPAEGLSRLSRLGITFNEVQEAQIKTLDELGMKAEAQAKILDEIRRQFGGAAADYGNTVAGQLDILNAHLGDLKKTIGEFISEDLINAIRVINGQDPINPRREAAMAAIRGSIGLPNITGIASERMPGLQTDIQKRSDAIDTLTEFIRNQVNDDPNGVALLQPYLQALQDQQRKTEALLESARRLTTVESAARSAATSAVSVQLSAIAAGDAGSLVGRRLYGMLSDPSTQRSEVDRTLQATESRFLTRGRGQLTTAEQKNLEEQKKQTDLLARIERDLNNLPTGMMLIVEGVN